MIKKYISVIFLFSFLAGCQTVSQSETPALYDVLQRYKELAGRACVYGNSNPNSTKATGVSNIQQATADPSILRANVTAPGATSTGQLVWNTRTGQTMCGNSVSPPGIGKTGWINLSEEAARRLSLGGKFKPYGKSSEESKNSSQTPTNNFDRNSALFDATAAKDKDRIEGRWDIEERCRTASGNTSARSVAYVDRKLGDIFSVTIVHDNGERSIGNLVKSQNDISVTITTNEQILDYLGSVHSSRDEIALERDGNCFIKGSKF